MLTVIGRFGHSKRFLGDRQGFGYLALIEEL
jgi:hypothetical protein